MVPVAVSIFFMSFFGFLFGLDSPTYIDYLYCAAIVVVLYLSSKKNVFFVVNSVLLLLIFYVSGAIKMQYFGEPATPADIVSLVALYGLQSSEVKLYVGVLTLLLGILLFANIEFTKKSFALFAGAVIVLFSGLLLGANADLSSSFMQGVSKSKSISVRQYYAIVRFYDEWLKLYDSVEVEKAYKKAGYFLVDEKGLAGSFKRNIYLIVIESLWDPSVLGEAFVTNPINDGFGMLWRESGQSYLLGPAFGGGTANPEFEVLCGAPVNSGLIVFEHPLLHEGISCLPNILSRHGYLSVAAHPNSRDFWNRDFSYPAIGFDRYYSIEDFNKDEVIGSNYLSDRSLYSQYRDRSIEEQGLKFNYILTVSEHYPYMSSAETISVRGGDDEPVRLLKSYVGLIERATKDVTEFIDTIRAVDKDALIVVLGDHPPLFGKDFAVYREAGLIVNQKSDMTVPELLLLYSTPVIVVDGLNGAVKPKIKSMYELPSMIMRLLTCYGKSCDAIDEASVTRYRPVGERGVLYNSAGKWELCEVSDASEGCSMHLEWLAAAKVLRNNLVLGGRDAKLNLR